MMCFSLLKNLTENEDRYLKIDFEINLHKMQRPPSVGGS